MIKLTDLTLYCNTAYKDPFELIESQQESSGYAFHLTDRLSINIIKHTTFEEVVVVDGVQFNFFKGNNRFGFLSFKTVRHLRSDPPDIILLQGLIFPLQVILLRLMLGKKPVIVAQHHGELPSRRFKGRLQKLADKFISAYLFTSMGNAKIWLENKLISNAAKCFEILEASTAFVKQNKERSKIKTGLTGQWNFLWVGRLNANKDPLTVLRAFKKYLFVNPLAELYMFFHTDEMIAAIKTFISKNASLLRAIHLSDFIEHGDLQDWYSAADFFISGSHREGSGFALIEAMSCGCIPIITGIPTFIKISGNGAHAVIYQAGNSERLFEALLTLDHINRGEMSEKIVNFFKSELSFKAIADQLFSLTQLVQTTPSQP